MTVYRARRGQLSRPTFGGKLIRRIPVAKKQVVELICDRCGRTEYTEPVIPADPPDYALVLTFKERTIQWEDLCSSCDKAVTNYVKQLMREAKEEPEPGEDPDKQSPPPDPTQLPADPSSSPAPAA
jgi:hypothetical protein